MIKHDDELKEDNNTLREIDNEWLELARELYDMGVRREHIEAIEKFVQLYQHKEKDE